MTALHSFQDLHGKIKEAEKPQEASRKPGRLENGADAPHSRDREMAGTLARCARLPRERGGGSPTRGEEHRVQA